MAEDNLRIGGRVQRMRRQKKMSQADLAAVLGISASYLNLIEHNRRRITVPLLLKLCGYFGIEAGELAESDELRLVGDLMEIFGDNIFAENDLTNHDIRDLASSNPAVGRAMIRLFDRYRALRQTSTPPVEVGHHVATDAISDFIQENANYFPSLETEAERIRDAIDQAVRYIRPRTEDAICSASMGCNGASPLCRQGVVLRLDAAKGELVTADVLPMELSIFRGGPSRRAAGGGRARSIA